MDKVNKIINDQEYRLYLEKNNKHEQKRIYCKHDLAHFLDVARIGYIINLENRLNISKNLIYSSALLHDIGKWKQYESQIPHHIASASLSQPILRRVGFEDEEIQLIQEAILCHRDPSVATNQDLKGLLYKADKLSRRCFDCKAKHQCNWDNTVFNSEIIV